MCGISCKSPHPLKSFFQSLKQVIEKCGQLAQFVRTISNLEPIMKVICRNTLCTLRHVLYRTQSALSDHLAAAAMISARGAATRSIVAIPRLVHANCSRLMPSL
jgi:hypothetical protein